MKYVFLALVALMLQGCGGGGSSTPQAVCTPKPVTVQLFGDSTQVHQFNYGDLQNSLNTRYGTGAVTVINNAVSGTSSAMLVAGTDGMNAAWPASVSPTADIILMNHGINDENFHTGLTAFAANYQLFAGIKKIIFETPNPVNMPYQDYSYAATTRQVAASTSTRLADVEAYVLSFSNWQSMLPDNEHPSPALNALIANNVLMPALQPVIDPLRCK